MKNVRLLIADDDTHNLQFLSNSLSDDFCSVATVSDGKGLIAAAVALDPHIIITDMPTWTGLVAVRQLQALMPDIKIIVLTEQEEPEFAAATFGAGVSAVILKKGAPDLCGKIRAVIRDLLTAHPGQFTEKVRLYGNDHASIGRGVGSAERFPGDT